MIGMAGLVSTSCRTSAERSVAISLRARETPLARKNTRTLAHHRRGPELAASYYMDAIQQVPRHVWQHTELLAPDDAEDIGRRMRLGRS